MSHGDAVSEVPCGFSISASTADTPIAAFEDASGKIAGVQFHPESVLTEHGYQMLGNWLVECGDLEGRKKSEGLSPVMGR